MEVVMCVPGCEQAVRLALSRRGFFKGAGASAAAAFAATAVTPRPAVARTFTSTIDLTHVMSPAFPTFFGTPGIEMQRQFSLKKDGFNLYWWRIIEHAGTHMDAPIHFSENGPSIEQSDARDLVVPLAVIDVAAQAAQNPDYQVLPDDLTAWENKNGRLPDGCCVAMHSGWAKYAGDESKFTGRDVNGGLHFPGFGGDAAAWLMKERRVLGIAVDTLSLDHGASKDFKVHYSWLPSGRWGLENVANLDQVPANGATLVVGMPKVKDATGGPARLFALV
jgi:kynurenine formamidase